MFQAINDVRETVRVLAAKLIGEMKGVSQGYLEQVILASYWSILASYWLFSLRPWTRS